MRIAAVVVLGALAGLGACARHLPPQRPAAALHRDLERLVTVAETRGWGIDRQEIEGMLGAALDSVCRVEPAVRAELLRWLKAEVARQGGPVEEAWRARGKSMKAISDLLTLTRIQRLAEASVIAADADCPFWVEPDADFAGRQISDDRWTLSLGGGGKGMAIVQGGEGDLSFGGAGRAMFGRSVGSRSTFYGALEAGASANFPKDEQGMRGNLVLGVDLVVMGVYRYTLVNTYLELEGGYVAHVTESEEVAAGVGAIAPGFHVGASFGGRATRTRFFFPGAAFGISYEQTFPEDDATLHFLKVGFRVAFDIDF